MISVGLFSEDISVYRDLKRMMEWYNSLMGKPMFLLTVYKEMEQWVRDRSISEKSLLFFEVSDREDLETLKGIREKDLQTVIIHDGTIPPEEIVVPDIHPLYLIKKPFDKGLLRQVLQGLCLYLMKKEERTSFTRRFVCRDKTRRLWTPYSSIYYFETRNKRVVMATSGGEYEFYDSFSRMEAGLPEEFVRCHRSYIINLSYLTCVDFAHFQMELDGRILIPISKKYRRQVERVSGWEKTEQNKVYGTDTDIGSISEK